LNWASPVHDGVEVHAAAQSDAPVIERLGINLVRLLPDRVPPDHPNTPEFLHVATPSGKSGYVAAGALTPFDRDRMCYDEQASGWKIAGYLSGARQ